MTRSLASVFTIVVRRLSYESVTPMSARTEDDDIEYQSVGVDAAEFTRYSEVSLENGEVLVFDEQEEDAWIQSTVAVELDTVA